MIHGLQKRSPPLAERDRWIVACLHLAALGAELNVFTQEHIKRCQGQRPLLRVRTSVTEVYFSVDGVVHGNAWLSCVSGRKHSVRSSLSLPLTETARRESGDSLKLVGFLQIHLQIRVPPCSNTSLGHSAVRGWHFILLHRGSARPLPLLTE